MVKLETVNHIELVTDSGGWAAFDEPGLMRQKTHFTVSSPGYEFPKDGFGFAGVTLTATPGKTAEIKVLRNNIAERLYRLSGQGIYRDSELLGKESPLPRPVLNGGVLGLDSVQASLFKGRIFWLWGDTLRAAYPLGHFAMTGAVSDLPGNGGLDPSLGVHFEYFMEPDGVFARKMAPMEEPGLVWLDGVISIKDSDGKERLIAHYSRMKDLGKRLDHGIMEFNEEAGVFEAVLSLGEEFAWQCPRGHPVRAKSEDGDFFYFADPFCNTRVPASLDDIMNPARYQALAWSAAHRSLVWQNERPPIKQDEERKLVEQQKLAAEKARHQVRDAASGKPVSIHAGSIAWNEYRKRWIMIAVETGGKESFLGEVWLVEAPQIDGPWEKAVKVATHPKYSFYNPCHHPFFDQEGGRIICFEGTYSQTFSNNPVATPRYDYNQLMYRLDLSDARLAAAQGR